MRLALVWISNLLLLAGIAGGFLAVTQPRELARRLADLDAVGFLGAPPLEADREAHPLIELEEGVRAIHEIRIPSIGLSSPVVPSPVVELPQAITWEVPPFRVGHAAGTSGAGQPGNVVLLGHVTSLRLGNVFEQLDRVRVGDLIYLSSDEDEFAYAVEDIRTVDRTDVTVVQPTDGSMVTLVTCTGRWLADLQDYSERLVVQAVLAE